MVETTQNSGKRSTTWLDGIGFYSIHVLISAVAIDLVVVFLVVIIEHIINPRVGDELLSPPFFPAQVTLELIGGFFVNRYLQCKSAKWTWVVPAALVFFYVTSEQGWSGTVTYLFGSNCGDCFLQTITTGVVYGSIAYSLGAWAAMKSSLMRQHTLKSR
ncbi:MAG TPA: hypothetical protein VKT50_02355 [Candidatus Acidoferrales bacterium]|nr:hypothetical protein [Candidatus Acidoferrales bacterium]